jgi:hypothetical protein
MSSKGEPGGNSKGNGLDVVLIVCVLDIFTTEGISFSAKSAKDAGAVLLCTSELEKLSKMRIKQKLTTFL